MPRDRSLRVAHVTPAFHPADAYGGPPESAYQLAAHLARRGVDVRVLTTDANGLDRVLDVPKELELELESNLRVRYSRRRYAHAAAPDLLAQLPSYVRWADVVHLNAVYNFTTLPTLAACTLQGRPLVWSARGALQGSDGRRSRAVKSLWEAACRRLAPERLVLHVTSEAEAEASAPFFPRARVEVIPNGANVPPVLPMRSARAATLRIGSLGRIHPIKGLEALLRAAALAGADATMPAFRLRIAGAGEPGYLADLAALAASLGIADRVEFTGPLSGEAKSRFLVDSDVFVVPSLRENFGIAIAEALAHGTPVIASTGTPWACLEKARAGYWVPGDPKSIAAAMVAAAHAPLESMGLRGRELVKTDFSWAGVAAKMTRLYESLA